MELPKVTGLLLKENGHEPDPAVHEIFTKYVTTVNDGIFRAYTSNIHHYNALTNWSLNFSRELVSLVLRTSCSLRCRLFDARKTTECTKEIDEETTVFVKK